MFIKETFKDLKDLKELEIVNAISVFLYTTKVAKVADFRWKNADVHRTQGVFHVI